MCHSYARGRKIYGFSAKNAASLLWHFQKTKTNSYLCGTERLHACSTDIQRFSLWDRYRISKFPFITSSRAGNVCAIQCRRFTVFVRDRFWRTWYLRYGKRLHFFCVLRGSPLDRGGLFSRFPLLPVLSTIPPSVPPKRSPSMAGLRFHTEDSAPAPQGRPSPGLPFSPSLNAPDIQNNEINLEFVN